MKTSLERLIPLAQDIGTQIERHPNRPFVFFYDDGSVFRAFLCDSVVTTETHVEARDEQLRTLVMIPEDSVWRVVHKDLLQFVSGAELEENDLKVMKMKKDLRETLIKDLGIEMETKEPAPAIDFSQVPHRTGTYA